MHAKANTPSSPDTQGFVAVVLLGRQHGAQNGRRENRNPEEIDASTVFPATLISMCYATLIITLLL